MFSSNGGTVKCTDTSDANVFLVFSLLIHPLTKVMKTESLLTVPKREPNCALPTYEGEFRVISKTYLGVVSRFRVRRESSTAFPTQTVNVFRRPQ